MTVVRLLPVWLLGVEMGKESSIQLSDYINYQCGAATYFQHGLSEKGTVALDYIVYDAR